MEEEGFFAGASLAALDDKGRIALPAKLRKFLPKGDDSRQLFVTTHEVAPCLIGSGIDRLWRIRKRIKRIEDAAEAQGTTIDRFELQRRVVGPGEPVPIDASGRFVLSDVLVERGKFSGDLFLLGVGEYFEIWDLARLLAQTEPAYVPAQEAAYAALRAEEKKKAGGK